MIYGNSDPGDGLEPRRSGVLIEMALEALGMGPLPTAAIAERVLRIQGAAHAAAAAVFTLLGTDSRFSVDSSGVWSLAAVPPARAAQCLLEEEWVVVDVETTGGAPERGHRITEVAAVWVSNGVITSTYQSLVNPERRIPGIITSLTGITDAMCAAAPTFREIAPRFAEKLRGRVFVAHNAAFDWRFVGMEMERALGYRLQGRQLCTVRLGRKLLPELPSRSLDSLAHYFGLVIERRHRALDDAYATAQVLTRFFDLLGDRQVTDWATVEAMIRKRGRRRRRHAMPRSMDSA